MNHYIYMITNNINGMKYIGKRSCPCDINKDKYMGGGTRLKKDKDKFGIENFTKEILAYAFDEAMAFELENYYIKKLDAVDSEEYYNETYGGTGSAMFYHEDDEKRNRVRKILSEKNKGTNAGENSKVARKVICLTTGQVFISSAEASKFANMNRSSVNRVCRPDYHTRFAGKHPETGEKLEWMYYDEYLAIQKGEKFEYNPKSRQHRKSTAKSVICLNNLKVFKSITEASNEYGLKHASYISQCCLLKKDYAGVDPETGNKLRWMYYDDYLKNNNSK